MDTKRKIYLEDKPRSQALKEALQNARFTKQAEDVPILESLGRVTAHPIYATQSMPHYHASAMDGIAVKAETTSDAHEHNPVHLVEGKEFVYVDTGNAIPPHYDAVIMIEDLNDVSPGVVEIIAPATPWQRIRPIGEDITYGEMLLPQGHELRPVDMGALVAAGMKTVSVVKKPLVHIIPSGNEIVPVSDNVEPGKIIEFNGTIFSGLVMEWGGDPLIQPIVKDNRAEIRDALLKSAEAADIVVINAGSSAGSKDYTASVIEEIGTVLTHGIATRPGKPVIIGKVNETLVIGVPGYPVSAFLVMDWFVKPLIAHYLQVPVKERQKLSVIAGRRIVSNMGSEDFIRVNVGKVDGNYVANPLTRSASVTMSLVKSDGIVIVPPEHLGIEQGDIIEVELFRPIEEIDAAVLFSGSHDLCIDVLSALMKEKEHSSKIIASHTGSMAGISAIKRGEAHIVGIHLLDPETGEYNISYVKRFLKDLDIVLVPFLKRKQGFIVPKNNPLKLQTISDVAAKKATFVNRQRGAGTRILFDYMLSQENISPDEIIGYDREMFTHLSVAAEVNMDKNNVGMGIYSAATAMDLDFIPVSEESYDLIMNQSFFESEKGQKLLQVMRSVRFRKTVEEFGGYEVCTDIDPIFLPKN